METAKACSTLIIENKENIISQWEMEVREEIMAAGMSTSLALRNHLPELLDDIAEIFIEKQNHGFNHKTDKYPRTFEKNKLHGRIRAETENYTIDQVILEYFILHRIVTELLQKHQLLTVNMANLLKYVLERTVMQASAAFSEAIQEMQDKLIGTLTHDIRNPLTTAFSCVELIDENPENTNNILPLLKKSILRSIRLAEGLLDTISLKAGQGMMLNFSEADYAAIIREACDEASRVYFEKLVCDLPETAVRGNMDAIAIRRMIDNLISNAVKYGDAVSSVLVTLQETKEEVTLMVRNQGDSIPVAEQQSIFDFLNRNTNNTPPLKKGWGMGLALVKLIAEAHEGFVDLESNDEEGTTFKVTLKRNLEHSGKVRMKLS